MIFMVVEWELEIICFLVEKFIVFKVDLIKFESVVCVVKSEVEVVEVVLVCVCVVVFEVWF